MNTLILIGGNDSLEAIDLSWNNIRGRSAIDIANGIKVFISLKMLNVTRKKEF